MRVHKNRSLPCFVSCVVFSCLISESRSVVAAPPVDGAKVRFKKTSIDSIFRSEGVAVADINGDGKKDIVAGYVWYSAPDWKMNLITDKAPEYDPKGYSNSFCTFADDLNGDNRPDVIVVDFPGTPTWWFENPSDLGQPWTKHVLTPVTNNESPQYLDVDGDGKSDLLCGFNSDAKDPDSDTRQMGFASRSNPPSAIWILKAISGKASPGAKKYDHGLGLGDLNGDGRKDVLCPDGWWEAPASSSESSWKFHANPFGQGAQFQVFDYDGDGDADVITSSPHAYGIWWHEQVSPGKFEKHEIDGTFSQTHSTVLADLNGDGLPDLVTGKRWWAHAAGDPGVDEPAVIYWFELSRENGKPVWIPRQFDHNSGVGTQFEVADVDGDGLLDVVTSNKKGVHFFKQYRD